MSDNASRADKLSAARKKLKEFQEQKKLREKNSTPSPVVSNPGHNVYTQEQNNVNVVNTGLNISQSFPNQSNVNETFQYLSPSAPPQEPTYNQLENNSTSVDNNISYQQQQNIENSYQSTNTLQSYFNNNVKTDSQNSFQNLNILHSFSQDNQFVVNNEENSSNKSNSNVASDIRINPNNMNPNVEVIHSPVEPLTTGNEPVTNHNILSVFTDSSNNSSFCSSTNTGPFLLNESPLKSLNGDGQNCMNDNGQHVINDSSGKSNDETGNRTAQTLIGDSRQCLGNENVANYMMNDAEDNVENQISGVPVQMMSGPPGNEQQEISSNDYKLFERKHNDNYFGINFGYEGPGIHMNVSPFEHRNKQFVHDFLDSLHEPGVADPSSSPMQRLDPNATAEDTGGGGSNGLPEESHKPINLLNENFRRNLLSLSTSKSTSIEDYTDKSRGNSVSKSVSLESSNAVNFDDMKPFRTDSNSSTVFSSCDNIRKLSSSANESSSEPPCTNSQCEENFLIEMEKRNDELSTMLMNEKQRTDTLEAIVTQTQTELDCLRKALLEKDDSFQSSFQLYEKQLKSQTHTLQILIEEKSQLELKLHSTEELVEEKNKEIDELKGRLAISKHKSANIERDVNVMQEKLKANEKLIQDLSAELAQERKQVEDLSEEKVGLVHKLDVKMKELFQASILLQEKDSQLSLLHLKVQQLSAAGGMLGLDDTMNDLKNLQTEKAQLEHNLRELTEHVKTLTRERDKTVQYHTQMIDSLKAKLDEVSNVYGSCQTERSALQAQNQNQIAHISQLEKQIQSLRESISSSANSSQGGSSPTENVEVLKNLVQDLENRIKEVTLEKQKLDTQLQAQVLENELAKEQIDQLAREIDKLEGDRPDASALLSAMESDKIAASRAVQQNNFLKQQLQELQDAVINLNNTKLELTEELERARFTLQEVKDQVVNVLNKYQHLVINIGEQISNQENEQLRPSSSNEEPNGNDRTSEGVVQTSSEATGSIHETSQDNDVMTKLMQLDRLIEVVLSRSSQSTFPRESRSVDGSPERRRRPSTSYTVPAQFGSNLSLEEQREALEKLENKFKQMMTDLADVSDEKQRLEHLVMQLQLETETIGEYAALYQKQRYLLQQKAREKDEQVKRSAKEQEALKQKLSKLMALVQEFIKDKNMNGTFLLENGVDLVNETSSADVEAPNPPPPSDNNKATEILALISDIGSNSLVDNPTSFHPCPVCFGQLITV